jgi:prolyl-tRNA editing enzyme YbaK/EbsC (Cys-tRNA(Pro) deacylase)
LKLFKKKHNINAEVIDTGVETASVTTSLKVLGLKREVIVKSIVFSSNKGIILTIVRGDQQISIQKLVKIMGTTKIKLADLVIVKEKTGYDVGGVPPISHTNPEI